MLGDTPQKQPRYTGPSVSRHNNQINVQLLRGLFDCFPGPSNFHNQLVPNSGQMFSRELLELELGGFG